jgi:large exoprotein involved in heme utilization and adhesion
MILANGEISSSTTTGALGNGGDVSVTAGRLTIDAAAAKTGPDFLPTGIIAETCCTGHAGRITVNAGSLSILNGGVISSSTSGSGNGGDVTVNVAGGLLIDGSQANPLLATGIAALSSPGSTGNAGSIELSAGRVDLRNGASISSAADTANGGNIALSVDDMLYLRHSTITTSVLGQSGNGGNITIDPRFVVLDRSSIIAQAIEGHGGNITITVGEFVPSADSIVSATSQLGISGTVEIIGPRVDVNGALVVLSSELRGRAAVLREACAASSGRPLSSLVEAGRGGLPHDVEATLPALYIAGRDLNPDPVAATGRVEVSNPVRTSLQLTMRCG